MRKPEIESQHDLVGCPRYRLVGEGSLSPTRLARLDRRGHHRTEIAAPDDITTIPPTVLVNRPKDELTQVELRLA